jgi:hypothetical protein
MPALTVDKNGEWKPLDAKGEKEYTYVAQVAPSGRAGCRACGMKIDKDLVRLGTPMKWRGGGEYGYINKWAHITCSRSEARGKALQASVHGLAALPAKDQKAVLAELGSDKLPVHLKPIDPNDASFLKRSGGDLAQHPTPTALSTPLLPFQQAGLGWMLAQERSEVRGGILADQMGLGKTIQTIALLLADRALSAVPSPAVKKGHKKAAAAAAAAAAAPGATGEPAEGPTLVIVPTSAMMQWASEIESHCAHGALKVCTYHGAAREKAAGLYKYDVVLTTYPIVEAEWRKEVDKVKVGCAHCARMFLPRTLLVHNAYFCGPDAVRTAKLAKREKKQKVANEKAMRTLKIKPGKASDVTEADAAVDKPEPAKRRKAASVPSVTNMYREVMAEAGRTPVSMYDRINAARETALGKDYRPETGVLEEEAEAEAELSPVDLGGLAVGGTLSVQQSGAGGWHEAKVLKLEAGRVRIHYLGWNKRHDEWVNAGPRLKLSKLAAADKPVARPDLPEAPAAGEPAADAKLEPAGAPRAGGRARKAPAKWSEDPLSVANLGGSKEALAQTQQWCGHVEVDAGAEREARPARRVKQTAKVAPAGKGLAKGQGKAKAKAKGGVAGGVVFAAGDYRAASVPERVEVEDPDGAWRLCTVFERADGGPGVVLWFGGVEYEGLPPEPYTLSYSGTAGGFDGENGFLTDQDGEDIPTRLAGGRAKGRATTMGKAKAKAKAKTTHASGGDDDEEESDEEESNEEFAPAARKGKGKGKAKKAVAKTKRKRKGSESDEDYNPGGGGGNDDEEPEESNASWLQEVVPVKAGRGKAVQGGRPAAAAVSGAALPPGREEDEIDLSGSTLISMRWGRLVLDEAHKIKGRTTNTAKAVYALQAERKWCLTGTPLQNRVGELYSLIRFLKLEPHAFYFCKGKGCECKSLAWNFGPMSRVCSQCGHPPMKHFSQFNRSVINPIQKYGYAGEGKRALLCLKEEILDRVQLRRTKDEVCRGTVGHQQPYGKIYI